MVNSNWKGNSFAVRSIARRRSKSSDGFKDDRAAIEEHNANESYAVRVQ